MAAMALVTTETPGRNALLPMLIATAIPIATRNNAASITDAHIITRINVSSPTQTIAMNAILSGSRLADAVSTITLSPYLLLMAFATSFGDALGSKTNWYSVYLSLERLPIIAEMPSKSVSSVERESCTTSFANMALTPAPFMSIPLNEDFRLSSPCFILESSGR